MALKCVVIRDKNSDSKSVHKYYSDAGKYIIQRETGKKYTVAVDSTNTYTYYESTEYIPVVNIDKYKKR